MSNPVEKYLQETGQTTLIVKIDKFLNKDDIEELQSYVEDIRDGRYYNFEKEKCDELTQKLEYIKGLLK